MPTLAQQAAGATQAGRPFQLKTQLGDDVLLLTSWTATEGVSDFFRITVQALSERADIGVDELLLTNASVHITLASGGPRIMAGIVGRFVRGERLPSGFTRYELDIVPVHQLLTQVSGSHVHTEKAVPDVLREALKGVPCVWELQGSFEPHEYATQYRESYWNFAARHMELNGIWFRFQHEESGTKMVVANAPSSARAAWGLTRMPYGVPGEGGERLESVYAEYLPSLGKVEMDTYHESIPGKVSGDAAAMDSTALGPLMLVGSRAPRQSSVDFDQHLSRHFSDVDPSGGERAGDLQKLYQEARAYAQLRQQEAVARDQRIVGSSTFHGLESGARVSLEGHPADAMNGDYFVVRVVHSGSNGTYVGDGAETQSYANEFEAIPLAVPYRPPRVTPWPRIGGTQLGLVVGRSGQEIDIDKYGRVRVALPWDRDQKDDGTGVYWMRVVQGWAGKGFGMYRWPRIGEQVLVEFLNGDPDAPVVVGCLYQAENMPPYALPDNKTRSGIKTRSTMGGATDTFNELRFEDKKDSEEVYFQAQKDLNSLVKNDETREVQHDRTTTIKNNDTRTVKEGDDTHTVEQGKQTITVQGDKTLTVKMGNRAATIDQGNDTLKVSMGNLSTEVSMGNIDTKAGMGNISTKADLGNISTEASIGNIMIKAGLGKITIEAPVQGIELKCGPNSIKMDPTGITISGMMVKVDGTVMTQVKGVITQVEAAGLLTAKGAITMIN